MDSTTSRTLAPTRAALEALKARVRILKAAADLKVGDAERVAFHARKAAERQRLGRTRNNQLFGHGSNAEVLGYVDVDDLAVCGLEANGDLYAMWVALAACALPGSSRAELIRFILRSPDRLDWCRKEGARVRWHFARASYEAELANWRAKELSRNQLAEWRKRPPTARQTYMVALISARAGLEHPLPMRRGKTHDWIDAHGGDPKFWDAPPSPPQWSF